MFYINVVLGWEWAWNVSVWGKDIGNGTTVYNSSTYFTYNLLKAMIVAPTSLTWAALNTATTNQKSNNDPTIINNTGNYNSTLQLTAINLLGQTSPSNMIPANNFTTSNNDGTGALLEQSGKNGTATTITGTVANRGNLSVGSGAGQENLYYCIPLVPNVPSQTYSTQLGGSWTILYP